jgi:hypothetical protein
MADVPKIVRQRLKAAIPGGTHPDADLLAAYSERSLAERERSAVLEHLSRCAECREIVALALPATESLQALSRPSRSWLAWPAFRWGFASAGLAIIAAFAALQYRHQNRPAMALKSPAPVMEAKTEPTPAISAQEDKSTATEAKAKFDLSKDATAPRRENLMAANKHADTATANEAATIGGLVTSRNKLAHGPLESKQWQQQYAYSKQAPAPEMRVPSQLAAGAAPALIAPQPVAVQPQSPPIGTKGQNNLDLAVNNQPLTHLQPLGGQAESEVEKAKPAVVGGPASKTVVNADTLALQARSAKAFANTPRWTINSAGGLQRSYDQGVTWQDVSVASAPAAANVAMELSAAPSRATAASSPSPTLAKKEQDSPPVFRTVAANGSDVWAGGANGVLYHSTDAGAHWSRVTPSNGDVVLSGDILTMEFPDPQHGKIVTSTSETWNTGDRGLTWQKQ